MKLVIISLDMLVALPILSVAMLLLFSSIRGTQGYLLALGGSQGARLNALVASQRIAQAIDASYNYSVAMSSSESISSSYGLVSRIVGQYDAQACGSQYALCRLVTVSGSTYLLVVNYENAS